MYNIHPFKVGGSVYFDKYVQLCNCHHNQNIEHCRQPPNPSAPKSRQPPNPSVPLESLPSPVPLTRVFPVSNIFPFSRRSHAGAHTGQAFCTDPRTRQMALRGTCVVAPGCSFLRLGTILRLSPQIVHPFTGSGIEQHFCVNGPEDEYFRLSSWYCHRHDLSECSWLCLKILFTQTGSWLDRPVGQSLETLYWSDVWVISNLDYYEKKPL